MLPSVCVFRCVWESMDRATCRKCHSTSTATATVAPKLNCRKHSERTKPPLAGKTAKLKPNRSETPARMTERAKNCLNHAVPESGNRLLGWAGACFPSERAFSLTPGGKTGASFLVIIFPKPWRPVGLKLAPVLLDVRAVSFCFVVIVVREWRAPRAKVKTTTTTIKCWQRRNAQTSLLSLFFHRASMNSTAWHGQTGVGLLLHRATRKSGWIRLLLASWAGEPLRRRLCLCVACAMSECRFRRHLCKGSLFVLSLAIAGRRS